SIPALCHSCRDSDLVADAAEWRRNHQRRSIGATTESSARTGTGGSMKKVRAIRHQPGRSRRGVLSMELVLTLPILFILLLGLFEFTMLFYSRSLVVEASRVGARKASLPGATAQSVEEEVLKVLSPRLQTGTQVGVDVGLHSGDVVMVSITTPMS